MNIENTVVDEIIDLLKEYRDMIKIQRHLDINKNIRDMHNINDVKHANTLTKNYYDTKIERTNILLDKICEHQYVDDTFEDPYSGGLYNIKYCVRCERLKDKNKT